MPIKSDGSLYIPTDWTRVNPKNGQFMKGHEPKNKGRKWEEWMSKKGQRRSAKGWKNLDKYRNCNGRADTAGRCRKEVVAVRNNGTYQIFSFVGAAAEWIGGNRENVGRCCRENQSRREKKHDWAPGFNKGTSRVNTDHQYKGVRFYFAADPIWQEKIGHDIV